MNSGVISFSEHGISRFQERGFTLALCEFVLFYGLMDYVGDDTFKYYINKKQLKVLLRSNVLSREERVFVRKNYERLIKKVILIASGFVVRTVYNR